MDALVDALRAWISADARLRRLRDGGGTLYAFKEAEEDECEARDAFASRLAKVVNDAVAEALREHVARERPDNYHGGIFG